MILLALLVFIAGVLTFLAPCTLPILPAYLSFSNRPSKVSTTLRTCMFGLGLMLIFLLFGLLAGSIGKLLVDYKRIVALLSGVLFIVLGIFTLLGKSIPGFSINIQPAKTLWGSFVFGVIFSLSWSGCIGPVLGFVLVLAANTQTAFIGGLLLLVYALGLLLPLLIVSVFIDRLPHNGKVWKMLKGRIINVGGWHVQSTELITGIMLILLGIIFITGLDAILNTSSFIGTIFLWEEQIANALNITVIT